MPGDNLQIVPWGKSRIWLIGQSISGRNLIGQQLGQNISFRQNWHPASSIQILYILSKTYSDLLWDMQK